MVKDKSERKEKHEKKEKRSEKDGVHKSKKDKKDKKDKTALADAVLKGLEAEAPSTVPVNGADATGEVEVRPVGALVPFAKPLLEDKAAKKALKSVKKGKLPSFSGCAC
jgi:H/ACA ribonucleoprotein complex subunit 2